MVTKKEIFEELTVLRLLIVTGCPKKDYIINILDLAIEYIRDNTKDKA